MRLTAEQFEAIDRWIVAEGKISAFIGQDRKSRAIKYAFDERDAARAEARRLLVDEAAR